MVHHELECATVRLTRHRTPTAGFTALPASTPALTFALPTAALPAAGEWQNVRPHTNRMPTQSYFLRALALIGLFTVIFAVGQHALFILSGGETACFRALAVDDHPLTCAGPLVFIVSVVVGLIAGIFLVPLWLYLRRANWLPHSALFALALAALFPLGFAVLNYVVRLEHAGASLAAWESLEFFLPMMVALLVIAFIQRGWSAGQDVTMLENAA